MYAGNIPIEINHSPRPLARDVQQQGTRNGKVVATASGRNIKTQGTLKPKGTATWSIPKATASPEAQDFLAEMESLYVNGDEFTFSYTLAGSQFIVSGCSVDDYTVSTDQDGTADLQMSWSGENLVGPV